MNKKFIKIVSILLMVMMLVSISVSSFAAGKAGKAGSMIQPNGVTATPPSTESISNVGNSIVGIIQTIGIIISVITLIVLGIKYMMGSAEEKAEYKKTLLPYVIGAALIFAASVFAQLLYNMFTGISV